MKTYFFQKFLYSQNTLKIDINKIKINLRQAFWVKIEIFAWNESLCLL